MMSTAPKLSYDIKINNDDSSNNLVYKNNYNEYIKMF